MFIWPFVKAVDERRRLRRSLHELRLSNDGAGPIVTFPAAALIASNIVATGSNAPPKTLVFGDNEEVPTFPPLARMV